MDTVTRATKRMQDTETFLRDLLGEAAASGDYASVVQIASWARTLHELVKHPTGGQTDATTSRKRLSQKLAKAERTAPPRQPAVGKRDDYPRFYRQGDHLVRIAWSKRESREYRHTTPYTTLKAIVNAIASIGNEGRVFSTDQFLPIHDLANGSEVPSYQAYVGVSLLKKTGLIDQHGRQGYSIPRIAEFIKAVEAVWKKLPEC